MDDSNRPPPQELIEQRLENLRLAQEFIATNPDPVKYIELHGNTGLYPQFVESFRFIRRCFQEGWIADDKIREFCKGIVADEINQEIARRLESDMYVFLVYAAQIARKNQNG